MAIDTIDPNVPGLDYSLAYLGGASRTTIAFALVGQSNERGQVTFAETIGGVPSRTAYPQAFGSLRNSGVRAPIGPSRAPYGGMHFALYDAMFDYGYDTKLVNGSIGSMSMLRDACGQIFDRSVATTNSFAARQKRDPIGPVDRGYRGDYLVANGKLFLCTTGRKAYCLTADTAVPGDTGVSQDLDFIKIIGTEATAAAAPDFSGAIVGSTVVDGTVVWTCVSASTVYLGYNYGAGACSETRMGFDPFGILRRTDEEMQEIRDVRERVVGLCNAQSDIALTSGQYQGALNSVSNFFLTRGYTVLLGLSVYNPAATTAQYDTLSAAVAASVAFLKGAAGATYSADRVRAGANLYQLMGSSGPMAAGGGWFQKDALQDSLHLNAPGAITAGGHWANAVKSWLPRQAL